MLNFKVRSVLPGMNSRSQVVSSTKHIRVKLKFLILMVIQCLSKTFQMLSRAPGNHSLQIRFWLFLLWKASCILTKVRMLAGIMISCRKLGPQEDRIMSREKQILDQLLVDILTRLEETCLSLAKDEWPRTKISQTLLDLGKLQGQVVKLQSLLISLLVSEQSMQPTEQIPKLSLVRDKVS